MLIHCEKGFNIIILNKVIQFHFNHYSDKMRIARALRINCFIFKILLLFPLTVTSTVTSSINTLKFKHSWTSSLVVLFSVVIYDVLHISTNLSQIQIANELLTFILNTYSQYASAIVLTFIICLRVVRQRSIIKFLNILTKFDDNFQRLTLHSIDNFGWIRDFLLSVLMGVCIIGYTEWSNCLMFFNVGPSLENLQLCMLMCYVPVVLIFMAEVQYLGYLYLVKMRYDAIMDQIMQIGTSNGGTRKLQLMMVLYEHLSHAVRLINSTFSLQNLVVLVYQFMTLVLLSYNFFIDFTRFVCLCKHSHVTPNN